MNGAFGAWRIAWMGLVGFVALILIYLVAPTLVVVPLSFSSEAFLSFPPPGYSLRWYESFVASLDFRGAIWNSISIGLPSAALATVAGTLAALALTRGGVPFRRLLAALMLAPLILPQIVLALGLFPVMARIGLIGTYGGIILAHAVVTMPLVFITVSAALANYPAALEHAALTLGANGWKTFRYVTLPMIKGGVVIGFIFAFTFSFDELILAIFLTSPATRTVPRLLWEQLNYQMTPIIAAATVVILATTLTLLYLGAVFERRSHKLTIRAED
jgi:putative spermidine/putrescine transport system permease protein